MKRVVKLELQGSGSRSWSFSTSRICLREKAADKGIALETLVNDLLKGDIDRIEAGR